MSDTDPIIRKQPDLFVSESTVFSEARRIVDNDGNVTKEPDPEADTVDDEETDE